MSGPSHGSPGRARALEGERPVARAPARSRDEPRTSRAAGLGTGRRSSRMRSGRRVRGEDDVGVGAADAVGEDVEERLVVVPALDEHELGAAARAPPRAARGSRRSRAASSGARGRARRSRRRRPASARSTASRDPRPPVLHADVDRHGELALERGALRLRDLVQRRATADAPVALGQLATACSETGRPAADVLEVGADVLQPSRGCRTPSGRLPAFTQARGPRCARARARAAGARSAGSVSGRTPWPRLKMCPGRPPAALEDARRLAASTRSQGPSRSAGSRFPCTPRSCADELPAAVDAESASRARSRRRPPRPSPRSRCAVPVPKWIVGAATAARIRSEYGATNSS